MLQEKFQMAFRRLALNCFCCRRRHAECGQDMSNADDMSLQTRRREGPSSQTRPAPHMTIPSLDQKPSGVRKNGSKTKHNGGNTKTDNGRCYMSIDTVDELATTDTNLYSSTTAL